MREPTSSGLGGHGPSVTGGLVRLLGAGGTGRYSSTRQARLPRAADRAEIPQRRPVDVAPLWTVRRPPGRSRRLPRGRWAGRRDDQTVLRPAEGAAGRVVLPRRTVGGRADGIEPGVEGRPVGLDAQPGDPPEAGREKHEVEPRGQAPVGHAGAGDVDPDTDE